MKKTLLIVDDEPSILTSLSRLLHDDGYHVLTADSGADALRLLAENDVQVILSDQRMPAMTGVELLIKASALYPHAVRMVLSGYADIQAITDAVNSGHVYKFLFKPWDGETLRANIHEAFDYASTVLDSDRFSHIYKDTQEGIFVADLGGVIQSVNPAFSALSGYEESEVIGQPSSMLKSNRHDDNYYVAIWQALCEQGKWAGEIWIKRKTGEIYPALLNISCIKDIGGRASQYVGVLSDLSAQKRKEDAERDKVYHEALTDAWRAESQEPPYENWTDKI